MKRIIIRTRLVLLRKKRPSFCKIVLHVSIVLGLRPSCAPTTAVSASAAIPYPLQIKENFQPSNGWNQVEDRKKDLPQPQVLFLHIMSDVNI